MSIASETQHGVKVTTFIFVGLIVVFSILFHQTGGIAGLVQVVGVIASLWAFRNPKTGLYILGFFCFYLDFVKKLAVTFGAQSMQAVIEVLAIQMLVLGCMVLGMVLQLILFERRFKREHFWICAFVVLLTGAALGISIRYGLVTAVQNSVNSGLYAGVILVLVALFHGKEALIKYLDFLLILAIPWALYGIYQYFFGYADFEWAYARTWFSSVSSYNMLSVEGPRPFGFASGPQGFGVLTQIMNYALWRAFLRDRIHGVAVLACIILGIGLFCSLQRTMLLQPIIFLVVYFAMKKPFTTKALYVCGALMLITGILTSSLLLSKLETVTSSIKGEEGWSAKVLNVNSFSDRLQGWGRLSKASTYTLLGNRITHGLSDDERRSGGEEYSHDMVNMMLDELGLLGLGLAVVVIVLVLKLLHTQVWQIQDIDESSLATCMLATGIIQLGLSSFAGSNMATVPHNLVNWTFFGVVVALVLQQQSSEVMSFTRRSGEPLATAGKIRVPFKKSGDMAQQS